MSSLGARLWPFAPWALLGTMLSGLSVMAVIASSDPSFALEKNYYAKAVAYDGEMAQRVENTRLGWTLEIQLGPALPVGSTPLEVRLTDAAGRPVAGARASVEALSNAHASEVLATGLEEAGPGRYRAAFPVRHSGLWELRFRFERGSERFTRIERLDVVGAP